MREWRFLLDENVDPATATFVESEPVDVEHVRDALWPGADDRDDVLPYARETDRIVVTSDVTDFSDLDGDRHAGIVLLFDDTTPAAAVASGLLAMVEAYPTRDEFAGREVLDAWL